MENTSELPQTLFPELIHSTVEDCIRRGFEIANMQVRAALRENELDPDRIEELLQNGLKNDPYVDRCRTVLSRRFAGYDPYLVAVEVEMEKLLRGLPGWKEARVRKQIISSYNRRNIPLADRFPE